MRYEYRQGKGNVIRTMFREVEADCYLMIDGDDTYPAEHARQMVDLVLKKGVDMVVGDRLSSTYFEENKRLFHNSGNRIVRGLINGLFHSNVRDIMTGQRAFSRLFVKTFPVLSKGFEIETEMTIHALDKNFLIEEIPVTYRDRPEGSVSKLNTLSDGIKVLKTIGILFLEYKPFTLLAGLAVLIWVIMAIIFFQAKGTTMLFAGGLIGIAGLKFFVCGIVLSVITQKHKKLYEMWLTQFYEQQKK